MPNLMLLRMLRPWRNCTDLKQEQTKVSSFPFCCFYEIFFKICQLGNWTLKCSHQIQGTAFQHNQRTASPLNHDEDIEDMTASSAGFDPTDWFFPFCSTYPSCSVGSQFFFVKWEKRWSLSLTPATQLTMSKESNPSVWFSSFGRLYEIIFQTLLEL